MSERLRLAYLAKEEKRIQKRVQWINREHLARMRKAGDEFKRRRKEEAENE